MRILTQQDAERPGLCTLGKAAGILNDGASEAGVSETNRRAMKRKTRLASISFTPSKRQTSPKMGARCQEKACLDSRIFFSSLMPKKGNAAAAAFINPFPWAMLARRATWFITKYESHTQSTSRNSPKSVQDRAADISGKVLLVKAWRFSCANLKSPSGPETRPA